MLDKLVLFKVKVTIKWEIELILFKVKSDYKMRDWKVQIFWKKEIFIISLKLRNDFILEKVNVHYINELSKGTSCS